MTIAFLAAGVCSVGCLNMASRARPYLVHPWPGGGAVESPHYSVVVGGGAGGGDPAFVWFTSAAGRQPVLPGSNKLHTSVNKDTSWVSFDMSAPTLVTMTLNHRHALSTAGAG